MFLPPTNPFHPSTNEPSSYNHFFSLAKKFYRDFSLSTPKSHGHLIFPFLSLILKKKKKKKKFPRITFESHPLAIKLDE